MTTRASLFFAFRMIKPNGTGSGGRKSLLGAVTCIALSIIPLVIVVTVADGMISGITERMINLSSYHARIYSHGGIGTDEKNTFSSAADMIELARTIEAANIDGIKHAFAEKQGIALAAGAAGRLGVTVRAVEKSVFGENTSFSSLFTVQSGKLELPEKNSALIGSKIASTLNLKEGSILRIITLRNSMPRIASFKVAGIISCGYQELDALWVFVDIENAYSMLSDASSVSFIGIETENSFGIGFNRTIALLNEQLETFMLSDDFYAVSWDEINGSQYENFASTKTLILIIMILIVFAASVNISGSLTILAIERKREIAILKSCGAFASGISFAFLLTGLFAGSAGLIVGLFLGLLCATNINFLLVCIEKLLNFHVLNPEYYLQTIPVVLPFSSLFLIAAGTLVLSIIASVAPSIKAGKEKTIDILHKG
ncbi:MAG: ABC transporter permease [Treponemataceae bacterium]|nr:MAG: ABC transporter permease [Treponemataceae bacterium]